MNRRYMIGIGLATTTFVIGYLLGRHFTPAEVVVTEKIRTVAVEKQVVVEKVKTEVKVVQVQAERRNVRTEVTTEKKPDGTVVTKSVKDDKTEVASKTDTNLNLGKHKTSEEERRSDFSYEGKTVTKPPSTWSISLLPGYDFAGAVRDGSPFGQLVVGAAVDRRLMGPLHVGAWANSAGAGGLSLRVEF